MVAILFFVVTTHHVLHMIVHVSFGLVNIFAQVLIDVTASKAKAVFLILSQRQHFDRGLAELFKRVHLDRVCLASSQALSRQIHHRNRKLTRWVR